MFINRWGIFLASLALEFEASSHQDGDMHAGKDPSPTPIAALEPATGVRMMMVRDVD